MIVSRNATLTSSLKKCRSRKRNLRKMILMGLVALVVLEINPSRANLHRTSLLEKSQKKINLLSLLRPIKRKHLLRST
jgi:hypothetical protein